MGGVKVLKVLASGGLSGVKVKVEGFNAWGLGVQGKGLGLWG